MQSLQHHLLIAMPALNHSFFERAGSINKTLIVEDDRSQAEGSLKWKRRHKRRKKAPNRRPKRGK